MVNDIANFSPHVHDIIRVAIDISIRIILDICTIIILLLRQNMETPILTRCVEYEKYLIVK